MRYEAQNLIKEGAYFVAQINVNINDVKQAKWHKNKK
jgi:hypothetical protein